MAVGVQIPLSAPNKLLNFSLRLANSLLASLTNKNYKLFFSESYVKT